MRRRSALIEGDGGERQFSDRAVLDPGIVDLRRRVVPIIDPALGAGCGAYHATSKMGAWSSGSRTCHRQHRAADERCGSRKKFTG